MSLKQHISTVAFGVALSASMLGVANATFSTQIGGDTFYTNPSNVDELIAFDGAATSIELDLAGLHGMSISQLNSIGTKMYYVVAFEAGAQLFVYDSSVAQSGSNPKSLHTNLSGHSIENLTEFSSNLYFKSSAANGHNELYRLNPTTEAVSKISSFATASCSNNAGIGDVLVSGSTMYLKALLSNCNYGLYSYDGSIFTFLDQLAQVNDMVAIGDVLYFESKSQNGSELWYYDPTNLTSVPIYDEIDPDAITGYEDIAFAEEVTDLASGSSSSSPSDLHVLNGKLYFTATVSGNKELYEFDPATAVSGSNPALITTSEILADISVSSSKVFYTTTTDPELAADTLKSYNPSTDSHVTVSSSLDNSSIFSEGGDVFYFESGIQSTN